MGAPTGTSTSIGGTANTADDPERERLLHWTRVRRAPTLHEQIFESLRQSMIAGDFHPGQKINVRNVARQLGTSAMPVRDALRRLEAMGAVSIEPKKAPLVSTLSHAEFQQIIAIRRMLEVRAATLACERASAADVAVLQAIYRDISQTWSKGDVRATIRAHARFHFSLYDLCGESLLVSAIELQWLRCGPYIPMAIQQLSGQGAARPALFAPHGSILKGLEQRNRDAVARAVDADLDNAAKLYHTATSVDPASSAPRRRRGRPLKSV